MIYSDQIKNCYYYGLLGTLMYFHRKGKNVLVEGGVDLAIANGHVHILDWMYNNGMDMVYSIDAIKEATDRGYQVILDWFDEKILNNYRIDSLAGRSIENY